MSTDTVSWVNIYHERASNKTGDVLPACVIYLFYSHTAWCTINATLMAPAQGWHARLPSTSCVTCNVHSHGHWRCELREHLPGKSQPPDWCCLVCVTYLFYSHTDAPSMLHSLNTHFACTSFCCWEKCQPPDWWICPDPGLNQGPLDLQSNALPTELSRPANA